METRHDRLYTKDHEWVLLEGSRAKIGITDYAQDSLGAVVFVELPAVGDSLAAGDVLGAVESVKAASEVYTPLSGTVIAVNEALEDAPESLNEQPYEQWLAELELSDQAELGQLLDEAAYQEFCAGEEH
ncbi:MAG: glycine cleavage system protein GcvH [Eubacteriales bacterium]|nr:glycine cleavage system protein GcvH [Clostridiales bacterium]MDD2441097.1 glycine cleavage system protein GcvH [Eubacteriales bacterium]MDD4139541.1 glycine cleavage system protein GcvH [Eubacteriales bacterium]MDD4743764.1 glycine cleavage system protein GcvH [Eubacteriales bacterium]